MFSTIENFSAMNYTTPSQSFSYRYEGGINNLDGKGFLGYKINNWKKDDKGIIRNESIFEPYEYWARQEALYKTHDYIYRIMKKYQK